jgi:hypothetical protein
VAYATAAATAPGSSALNPAGIPGASLDGPFGATAAGSSSSPALLLALGFESAGTLPRSWRVNTIPSTATITITTPTTTAARAYGDGVRDPVRRDISAPP